MRGLTVAARRQTVDHGPTGPAQDAARSAQEEPMSTIAGNRTMKATHTPPLAAGLALAVGLLSGPAWSAPLEIVGDLDQHGRVAFQVGNPGPQDVGGLRFHLPSGSQVQCAERTAQGRSFGTGGSLRGGDRIDCVLQLAAGAGARSGGLAVSTQTAAGPLVQPFSASVRGGVSTPDQGFIVLIAGGVHTDSNSDGLLDAGEVIDYQYTLVNVGTLPLAGLSVADLAGAVSCPQATLSVAQHMVCTRSYALDGADATAGEVLNDIQVTGSDSLGQAVAGGDVVVHLNLQARAGIRVFKSPLLLDDGDGNGFASVGDTLLYTFVVKNSNAEALSAVALTEPDPSLIDGPIVCEATTLGGAAFALGGGLASLDTAVCTAPYTIQPSDGAVGQVVNLVQATGQAAIAGGVKGTGASLVLLPGESSLVLTKTAAPLSVLPGGGVTYTITVLNSGSLPLSDVEVIDPVPAGLTGFAWTCAGAACPNASGSGAIAETIAHLPIGGQVVYTVTATVTQSPPSTIVNEVTVTPEGLVLCSPTGEPPPCRADARVVVGTPAPVPLGGGWPMALMVLGLWGVAVLRSRH